MSAATATAAHAAATATHAAATATSAESSAATPGGPEAGISMVALPPRRFALPNSAESATVFAGITRRNLPIAHSLASGLGGASSLRLSRRSTSLQILAHVASITVGQGGVRIRHATAMRGIVSPCASSTQAGAASRVEIIPVNEAVIDKDTVAAPSEPPPPSAPASPSTAKI
jgi:hypothetical protein